MPIIDTSYFQNELSIGQITSPSVIAAVALYIEKYEEEYLSNMLGYELYKEYKAGIAVLPTPLVIWTNLRDGVEYTYYDSLTKWKGLKFTTGTLKRSPIANYVYYNYLKDTVSFTMGSGEVKPQSTAVVNVSPMSKMVRAWNEMVDWNRELIEYLDANETLYTGYEYSYARDYLLRPINSFNL
ncbi:MAG: hypothetical protein H0X46_06600 [Bacteroidetes bacterium]|nr:hypothetical protein [Bacteroidota bacterium]